jgi:RHH-type proline utilization regulon transcriptional repressor/proline dehydrogenase/delta 1-pyrroline-5-carboxylate dehydrogenase
MILVAITGILDFLRKVRGKQVLHPPVPCRVPYGHDDVPGAAAFVPPQVHLRVLDAFQLKVLGLAEEVVQYLTKETPLKYVKLDFWRDKMVRMGMGEGKLSDGLSKLVAGYSSIRSSRQLREAVREHLGDSKHLLPWYVKIGFLFRPLFQLAVWQITKRFVIAPILEKAVPKVQKLAAQGVYATMDLVGESAKTEAEATAKFNEYRVFLEKAAAEVIKIPHLSVSLKLTAITTDLLSAEKRVELKERMRVLLRLMVKAGGRLTIDMEQYRYKDVTFRFFRELLDEEEFQRCDNLEIVVQAYLKDAEQDVASLLSWAEDRYTRFGVRIPIRLVKGAYTKADPEEAQKAGLPRPLCADQEATNANYDKVARMLLDKYHCVKVAFGSHNPTTIFKVLAYAVEKGIAKEDLEIQMLYGMASSPLLVALAKAGYRATYYTPIGKMNKAIEYLARRMDENKNLGSCLVAIQEFFGGQKTLGDLLFGTPVAVTV